MAVILELPNEEEEIYDVKNELSISRHLIAACLKKNVTTVNVLTAKRGKGGAQSLCDKIIEEIGSDSVMTNEFVTSIKMTSSYVEVTTKHATYRCRAVIVAVPPKQVLNIKFSPSLPEKFVKVINSSCLNTITNFVATYETEFWREKNFSGECYFFDNKGPISYCTSISTPTTAAIAGRLFEGKFTSGKGPIYKNDVLAQLAEFFGDEALHPVDYYEKSWSSQMVGWQIGNDEYMNEICRPFNGVFWAGAETTQEWYGYLAGGNYSGIRAALEALYFLRPQVLTSRDIAMISPNEKEKVMPLRSVYGTGSIFYEILDNWKLITTACAFLLLAMYKYRKSLIQLQFPLPITAIK